MFLIVYIGVGWMYLVCLLSFLVWHCFNCLCCNGLYESYRAANMRVGLILQSS